MTTETPQTPEQASGAPREGAGPAGGVPRPGQLAARDEGAPRPGGPGGFAPRGPRPGFGGGERRPFGPPGARRPRRKVCTFCLEKVKRIDYKETARLRRFLSDRGKIDPRRKSGSCAKHQRMLTAALKRARLMALLPYTAEHIRAMLSPQQRAAAGGPPPPKPERPPYRPPGPPMAPRPQPPQAAPEQGGKTAAE